jgi:phage tail protein X
MPVSYITSEHDALDLICARHYGTEAGAVEQVLQANPEISDVAHRLPSGLAISLPDLTSSEAQQTLKLWD